MIYIIGRYDRASRKANERGFSPISREVRIITRPDQVRGFLISPLDEVVHVGGLSASDQVEVEQEVRLARMLAR